MHVSAVFVFPAGSKPVLIEDMKGVVTPSGNINLNDGNRTITLADHVSGNSLVNNNSVYAVRGNDDLLISAVISSTTKRPSVESTTCSITSASKYKRPGCPPRPLQCAL